MRLLAPAALLVLLLAGCTAATPPAPATDAEVEEVLTSQFDAKWDALDLPRDIPKPDATTIEYTTRASWAYVQVTCLQEQGVPAREVSGDFSIDPDSTRTREESLVIQ